MKLEEAIAKAKILNDSLNELIDEYEGQGSFIAAGMAVSFKLVLDTILSALRPVSREQVEKMRGVWIPVRESEITGWDPALAGYDPIGGYVCSQCKTGATLDCNDEFALDNFCHACGAPMTDEAVEMVMERLEALKDGRV